MEPLSFELRCKPLQFGCELKPAEHEALINKIIAVYESELGHQGPPPRVTNQQLWDYRFVIQAWMQTVHECAKTDLDEANYKMVEQAVLCGDALDTQLVSSLKGFPLEFGLTMLPDVKSLTDEDVPAAEAETIIEKAEREEWTLGETVFVFCFSPGMRACRGLKRSLQWTTGCLSPFRVAMQCLAIALIGSLARRSCPLPSRPRRWLRSICRAMGRS